MSADHFHKYVDNYYEAIAKAATPEEGQRMLLLCIKEVERDARHAASRLAQTLANDIHNLRYQ